MSLKNNYEKNNTCILSMTGFSFVRPENLTLARDRTAKGISLTKHILLEKPFDKCFAIPFFVDNTHVPYMQIAELIMSTCNII